VASNSRERRLVFGEVAELYDEYRPAYPEVAFESLMEFAGLKAGDRALEVGCGTGRATVPLANRGLLVTALEPSPEMAQVARRNTAGLSGVLVEETSFESWRLPSQPFALVTSAQAWHWVEPEVRYQKAHRALGPGGCLALIWNTGEPARAGDRALEDEIEAVYQRETPTLTARVPSDLDEDRRSEIESSGLFDEVRREIYPWSTVYSADHYLGLLQTQSDHRLLDPAVRERLLSGIAKVLAAHDNQLPQNYRCCLYLARRRG
jgi:SAM-dependent methyltransferase